MRWVTIVSLLLLAPLLGACDDVAGLGTRSVDGEWRAAIDREEVWLSLRDHRGEIRGSGRWGYDDVFVRGERFGSEVRIEFDFDRYAPIELEGVVRGRDIEGRLYGSGFHGERVRFHRR
jgi:hypothetical protein